MADSVIRVEIVQFGGKMGKMWHFSSVGKHA